MPQEVSFAKRKTSCSCGAADSPLCNSADPVRLAICAAADINEDCNVKKAKIEDSLTLPSWVLQPILADEYLRDVETVPVYVAEITDRKQTSKLIKTLSSTLPLGNLQHLKRVRSSKIGMEVILRPCQDRPLDGIASLAAVLGNGDVNVEGISPHVRAVEVPKHPPMTRRQYERSNSIWPTQFHENKHVAKVLNDELFTDADKLEMEKYMALTVEAARLALTRDCATIVNPSTGKALVTAVRSRDHPLQHGILVALDLVARLQGGGSWDVPRGCTLYNISEDDLEVDGKPPYVCTGYDVYSTREPCLMCAMALVHSRIRRVFYGCPSSDGALGSCHKLHAQDGLNHHFEVWKGVLEEECASLSNKDDDS